MSFRKGETVVCVINSRASLTVGKEYLVKNVYSDDGISDLVLDNDNGHEYWYDSFRFISKSDFREFKINEILK
jgi:hypothetical protein